MDIGIKLGEEMAAERGIRINSRVESVFNPVHTGTVVALYNHFAWWIVDGETSPWTYDICSLRPAHVEG